VRGPWDCHAARRERIALREIRFDRFDLLRLAESDPSVIARRRTLIGRAVLLNEPSMEAHTK